MKKPTQRQQEIFEFLLDYISEHKFPPTIREIGEKFGIRSTNGVRDALKALERKGMIKKFSNQARGIGIIETADTTKRREKTVTLPLVGRIAAGTPILAEENIEGKLLVDKAIVPRNSEVFALRVYGDSMIGDGILDGDIAIIRMQKNAEQGQIVAAVIDGNATLKRYHQQQNQIELRASNAAYQPIIINASEDFSIAGILAGVIRKY